MSTRRSKNSTQAADALPRLVIEAVSPTVEGGRYPAKRAVGDGIVVGANVFREGHDLLAARVRYRGPGDTGWSYLALVYDPARDRWTGRFDVDRPGAWRFAVEGWTDVFGTWRRGFEKKIQASVDVSVELLEGAEFVERAAKRVRFGDTRTFMKRVGATLRDTSRGIAERAGVALDPEVQRLIDQYLAPDDLTSSPEYTVMVDRAVAAFASWYEFFPRSQSGDPQRHGTFKDSEALLPRIAELGFDVVYLPPIHPIGDKFRKGKNNSLTPEPDDVGSPWAIGSAEGGHTAVHPQLGTLADFDHFVGRARELGLEVALDYALQCSPDHPWVKEHPDWFHIRPDGSIQYAENPPKKYQDIYPINFWTDDREALWNACRDVVLFWIEHGVTSFRVDNPHTKPFAFWEWMIADIRRRHPGTVFFSEAFTAPKKLLALAKLGFQQSYTYFTWKNTSREIREWITEFSAPEVQEYYRGNFFANTPDILHEYLQHGGRPAFRTRLLLAGTLSPLYGIYSGYELCENVPVREGSEEYLNSEKYELRPRDWDAPGNINHDVWRLNRIRKSEPALQRADNLTFHRSDNDQILFYRKAAPPSTAGDQDGADLLIAVNLDPFHAQETTVTVPIEDMGIGPTEAYAVRDLLSGAVYTWRGARNYVRLDPHVEPGHLLRVERVASAGGAA